MTEQEKKQYFQFERDSQRIIDQYYMLRGHTVDRSTSCVSYDCILDGKYKVEEKIRQTERQDILVEFIQDAVTYAPGWFYETKCDYLHYVFMNEADGSVSRFVRLNWSKFKNWCLSDFLKNNLHPYSVISAKGWGLTINFSIPINSIPSNVVVFDSKSGDDNG